MKKISIFATVALGCVFGFGAYGTIAQQETTAEQALGLEAWNKVYSVLSHPRCANCHVPDDGRPRWSGTSYGLTEGQWRYHGMNVHGGESRIGIETLPCSTCHMSENSEKPHGPPGAETWSLPPAEMVWWQQSARQICEQLKDPARNGERSLDDIAEHVASDPLVAWGWAPGGTRESAPFSASETAGFIKVWAAAGAPCPVE